MRILITPHAIRIYQERIKAVDDAQAEAEIVQALQGPLFHCPASRGDVTLWGCRNWTGYPFVVATDPADEGAEFLLVRTCGPWWYWHECRNLWGKRHDLCAPIGGQPLRKRREAP